MPKFAVNNETDLTPDLKPTNNAHETNREIFKDSILNFNRDKVQFLPVKLKQKHKYNKQKIIRIVKSYKKRRKHSRATNKAKTFLFKLNGLDVRSTASNILKTNSDWSSLASCKKFHSESQIICKTLEKRTDEVTWTNMCNVIARCPQRVCKPFVRMCRCHASRLCCRSRCHPRTKLEPYFGEPTKICTKNKTPRCVYVTCKKIERKQARLARKNAMEPFPPPEMTVVSPPPSIDLPSETLQPIPSLEPLPASPSSPPSPPIPQTPPLKNTTPTANCMCGVPHIICPIEAHEIFRNTRPIFQPFSSSCHQIPLICNVTAPCFQLHPCRRFPPCPRGTPIVPPPPVASCPTPPALRPCKPSKCCNCFKPTCRIPDPCERKPKKNKRKKRCRCGEYSEVQHQETAKNNEDISSQCKTKCNNENSYPQKTIPLVSNAEKISISLGANKNLMISIPDDATKSLQIGETTCTCQDLNRNYPKEKKVFPSFRPQTAPTNQQTCSSFCSTDSKPQQSGCKCLSKAIKKIQVEEQLKNHIRNMYQQELAKKNPYNFTPPPPPPQPKYCAPFIAYDPPKSHPLCIPPKLTYPLNPGTCSTCQRITCPLKPVPRITCQKFPSISSAKFCKMLDTRSTQCNELKNQLAQSVQTQQSTGIQSDLPCALEKERFFCENINYIDRICDALTALKYLPGKCSTNECEEILKHLLRSSKTPSLCRCESFISEKSNNKKRCVHEDCPLVTTTKKNADEENCVCYNNSKDIAKCGCPMEKNTAGSQNPPPNLRACGCFDKKKSTEQDDQDENVTKQAKPTNGETRIRSRSSEGEAKASKDPNWDAVENSACYKRAGTCRDEILRWQAFRRACDCIAQEYGIDNKAFAEDFDSGEEEMFEGDQAIEETDEMMENEENAIEEH